MLKWTLLNLYLIYIILPMFINKSNTNQTTLQNNQFNIDNNSPNYGNTNLTNTNSVLNNCCPSLFKKLQAGPESKSLVGQLRGKCRSPQCSEYSTCTSCLNCNLHCYCSDSDSDSD